MPTIPPAHRHFLGFDRPLLAAAVEHLLSSSPGPELDLSSILLITPGRRASRMLTPMLVAAADRARRPLSPPKFSTPGDLAGELLGPLGRIAGPIARRLAWMDALEAVPRDALTPLIPHAPDPDRPERWAAIAEQLERTSDELAGELLTFADVPAQAPGLIDDLEVARWSAAALVQIDYEKALDAQGLIDAPLAQSRILKSQVARTGLRVFLIGVVQLPRAARAAIESTAAGADSLIAAPQSLADRFDDLGCILPESSRDPRIDIPEDRVIFADTPRDQAAHALASLADTPLGPSDAVIGVPDPEVTPHIRRLADRTATLTVRDAAGRPLSDSPPFRLLRAAADHLEGPTFGTLSAFVRHPDIEHWLLRTLSAHPGSRRAEWWLTAMDEYAQHSLPTAVGEDWAGGESPSAQIPALIGAAIDRLLHPLHSRAASPRDSAAALAALLQTIYHGQSRSESNPANAYLLESCRRVAAAITELGSLPPRSGRSLSAPQSIRLLLGALETTTLPPPPDADAIEMLGWLELPFDPAPVVIVTGMNEEHVPGRAAKDALLPDALRRILGLSSADARLARDTLLTLGLLASRRRVVFIAGRHSGDDDPLAPSRLLLAAPPGVMLARLRRFFDTETRPAAPRLEVRIAPGPVSRFPRRPQVPTEAPEKIHVTAFRDYLSSPYLFYLKHVLHLKHCDDAPPELDPLAYGDLMHEVLKQFGLSDARLLTDPARIKDFLDATLSSEAARRFGRASDGVVDLQLALLRLRLKEFARAQAAWRSDGWVIEQVEWYPGARSAPFDVDNLPIALSGRIDRIDRHDDGRIAILDYKSGDKLKKPDAAHRSRAGWKDLQLPLYRHLAAELNLPADPSRIVLGYFAIPRDPSETGISQASWGAADLASADDQARDVVRRVREGDFGDIGRPGREAWIFEVLTGQTFPDSDEDDGDEDKAVSP